MNLVGEVHRGQRRRRIGRRLGTVTGRRQDLLHGGGQRAGRAEAGDDPDRKNGEETHETPNFPTGSRSEPLRSFLPAPTLTADETPPIGTAVV